MELLYLYIEDDAKNIKDCEFNFSPEFHFSYDRNKKFVTVNKRDGYVPNFWDADNISNITAIIGKNGSGKSNLLEFIIRYYSSSFGLNNKSKRDLLHIYRFNGQIYVNRSDISSNYPLLERHYILYPLNIHNNANDTAIIYYTPHYEKDVLLDLNHNDAKDISNGGLLKKYGRDRTRVHDTISKSFSDIERLSIEDTLRQIELFMYSNTIYFEDVNLPFALNIIFKKGAKKLETNNILYNNLFIDKHLSELDVIEHVKNRLLYHYFSFDEYIKTLTVSDDMTFDDFIKLTSSDRFYFELVKLSESQSLIFENYPKQMGMSSDYLLKFGIKRGEISSGFLYGLYKHYFGGEVFEAPNTLEWIRVLYSNISFEWTGLSSGELEYFNLLARIYSHLENVMIEKTKRKKIPHKPVRIKNVILLLDESENSFHPEWQRLLLSNLIHFLKNALPFYSFQIILTSHSPILASDFPKSNIIFLDKDTNGNCKVIDSISRENTFGANIHTLYKNSFFLNGLPIGEFAKKKINRLFDELERGIIRKTTLTEIQLVGEPLLKEQLLKLYKQYADLPNSINDRIVELEKEVAILKQKLYDKN